MRIRLFLVFFLLILPALFFVADVSASTVVPQASDKNSSPGQVLVLHSYHAGMVWTDNIMDGISSVFKTASPKTQLHIEYLDTKRNPDPEYLEQFDALLQHKLIAFSFDLILVSDNDALNFALRHREDIFAGIPIVFCGINNFDPSMLGGQGMITGIAEQPSYRETLEMALQLHPETREVVVVGRTDTLSERLISASIDVAARDMGADVHFDFWSDLPLEVLQHRLTGLAAGQLVLLGTTVRNQAGRVFTYTESCQLIREACPVPLYGVWDFFLGHGIVGGVLVNGFNQGQLAANLAVRILRGENPDSLQVDRTGANVPMFDYLELRRFGISESVLPAGSVIIHQPPVFYPINKRDFWIVISVLIVLLLLIQRLWLSNRRRKKAEMAYRESEERLRLALDGSQDGMWDWNVGTGQNLVDDRWCKMLGYTKAEIVEHIDQWKSLVHPLDLPVITRIHQECLDRKISHLAGEFRMRTKSGEWKWILGRGAVVEVDGTGKPLRLVGTHKDISQQKATEQNLERALEEAEAARDTIKAILCSIADALIFTDNQGRIMHMNPMAERLFNARFETVAGKDTELLEASPVFNSRLSAFLAGDEESSTDDLELYHPELKEVRTFQFRLFAVHTHEGERAGAVVILQDVTRSREMDRMKSEFVSTAAHELRTPLTVILGFAELLLMKLDFSQEQKEEFLQTIVLKAEGLSILVTELLDLSRMESGGMIALNRVPCSLDDILLPLVDQYRKIYPGYDFKTEMPSKKVELVVDPGKMDQVIENLLSNAVKYSPGGGQVDLKVDCDTDTCRVSVTDRGIGMSPSQVAKVFDKFYRVDFANTAIGGLGLGMAIVHNIIEAHGGTIRVDSALGKGTTVTFNLPLNG